MTPTTTETLDSLMKICEISQKAIREIGQIEGKNELGSEQALIEIIVRRSKAILQAMPYLQFEDDEIEELDSKMCHRLNQLEDYPVLDEDDYDRTRADMGEEEEFEE
jgi:hypothetical protein